LRTNDLELQPDSCEHLADTSMEFPSQAAALAFDLKYRLIGASRTVPAGARGETPFRVLQAEVVAQQVALDGHQAGSFLASKFVIWLDKLHADQHPIAPFEEPVKVYCGNQVQRAKKFC